MWGSAPGRHFLCGTQFPSQKLTPGTEVRIYSGVRLRIWTPLPSETSWFVRAGQAGPFITPLVWLLALPCLEPEDLWSKLVPSKPFKGLSWCVLRAAVQPEVLRKPPVTDSKHRR